MGRPEQPLICSIHGCDLKVYGRGWCKKHWTRWRRNGDPELRLRAKKGGSLEEKFRHFMPGDPPHGGRQGPCWEWTGRKNDKGYGVFTNLKKSIRAHRVSYKIFKGEEPGPVLRHTCDNPSCCNPEHLVPGTFQDNSQDMVDRGRSRKGQQHPHAKLTENDVMEIRRLHSEGVTLTYLAAQFGITKGNASFITRGQTWTHV